MAGKDFAFHAHQSDDGWTKEETASPVANPMSVTGATFLLAGGTVGAGIIALPVKTYDAGFGPSILGLVGCWALLYVSALFLLELSLWFGEGANISTMAEDTLGSVAKFACVGMYLFVYGATVVAYVAEAPKFIVPAVSFLTGVAVPSWLAAAVFTFLWGYVIYLGSHPVNRVNFWCMAGCILAYSLLLVLGGRGVNQESLSHSNWSSFPKNLPLMVTALSFHNMVPSLRISMASVGDVRKAILYGSLVPLAMYALWELVIVGSLQKGDTIESVEDVLRGMKSVGGEPVVLTFEWFSFLAIITSFLGVGLGCLDFIRDLLLGFNVDSITDMITDPTSRPFDIGRMGPLALFLMPCYFIGIAFPHIFLSALEFSGTLRLLIFSVLPVGMVWVGRYRQNRKEMTFGGKWLLIAVLVISLVIIFLEWHHKIMRDPAKMAGQS
ncbi:hypothetical protein BSKO_09383 [Bryopsis sp. KO-2023]|nr:hypothetical protein BSKO_09383 [Bryopsis sp. KO-2023]